MSNAKNVFKGVKSFLIQLGKLLILPFVFLLGLVQKGAKKINKKQFRWVMPLVALISLCSFLFLVYLSKEEVGPAYETPEGGSKIEAVVIVDEPAKEQALAQLGEGTDLPLLKDKESTLAAIGSSEDQEGADEEEEVVAVFVQPKDLEAIPTFTLNDLLAPVMGEVITPFGWHFHSVFLDWRFHRGIDIKATPNTPVCAVWAGEVIETREDDYLGSTIIIEHSNDLCTIYAHLGKINTSVGNKVKKGEELGVVAQSELSQETHLHFELHHKGVALDPGPYYMGWKERN